MNKTKALLLMLTITARVIQSRGDETHLAEVLANNGG